MLVPAAIEAAKEWMYAPYFLKGKPVAVETQIRVNFSLSDGAEASRRSEQGTAERVPKALINAASAEGASEPSAGDQRPSGDRSTGSISGRVFLVTRGGDLKPARFANVYLMSETEDKNHESAALLRIT
jgi:hypothetical protein